MKLPDDSLQRTPEEAARRIALDFLAQAHEAVRRLGDPDDAEALHDFRVAIRRLRSTERAWRPYLEGAIEKKDRRALGDLAAATSGGRDAEVLLEQLAAEREGLGPADRAGFDWIVGELRRRRDQAYAHAREGVRRAFRRARRRLERRLEVMTTEVHLGREDRGPTWAEALAARVREHGEELGARLARVRSVEDRDEAHEARIAVKRLRYLLEPARPFVAGAAPVVSDLKRLQELLGDLHDSAVLIEELGGARERAGPRPDERIGLVELERRTRERLRGLYGALERDWLGGRVGELHGRVAALAAEIDRAGREDLEIERKYLLTGLPEQATAHPSVEIEQGYLPGDKLRERIRRVRHAGGVDYKRTVKAGSGVARIEIDEATTEAVFEAMWPLTEGCRVTKRRYEVPDGDLTWEIDEFTDRELYLAEVELPSADREPEIPAWLRPHVVREVTDEPAYVNLNLAR